MGKKDKRTFIGAIEVKGKEVPIYLGKTDEGNCAELINDNEIVINQDGTEEDIVHSILHEIGHALFVWSGLRQGVDLAIEEIVVQNYADFLRECPQIKIQFLSMDWPEWAKKNIRKFSKKKYRLTHKTI